MKQELYISHANSASTAVAKRFGGLLLNSSKGQRIYSSNYLLNSRTQQRHTQMPRFVYRDFCADAGVLNMTLPK